MKPLKITHRTWALLQSGSISTVSHGAATLRCEGKTFVMRGRSGEERLDATQTDAARLDAHWQQFAKVGGDL